MLHTGTVGLSGYGQHIDVAVIEPMFNTIYQQIDGYGYLGLVQYREMPGAFPLFFQAKDGWLHVSPHQIREVIDFLDPPELKVPKFKDPQGWIENMGEFAQIVSSWFGE